MVKKFIFGGVHLGGFPGEWYSQIMSKYLSLKYLLISKKTGTLGWAVQKFDFLGGFPGGWYPQTMSKYFSLKYLLISKKNGTLG